MLLEPASEDEEEYGMLEAQNSFHNSSSSGSNAVIFGFRAVAYSLQSLHPSLSQSAALFSMFAENVAPLIRIFHMPTLSRIYRDVTASLDSVDKSTEALLFAIYYSAVISISPEQCVALLGMTREAALNRNRFAVEQALARANLLNTQSTTLLQAAVLFVSALRNQDDSRTTWSLTSLVFHIAQAMGLHRDGSLFDLRPFETEMRRRLWWQICILDSRSSEYHGYEPIVHGGESAFDTRPPLHINDDDLHPDMTEAPAERRDEATDMTLTLIRCDAMRTGWKFGHVRPGGPRMPREAGERSLLSLNDRKALVRELEQTLQEKYIRHCDTSVPYFLVSSTVARLVIVRFWLVVHYQLNTKRGNDYNAVLGSNIDRSMRDQIFSASIEILELSSLLLTNKDLSKWTWYTKTHIQWHTVAFVLSELCSRPPSPECDRAWDYITTVYDGWKMNGSEKDTLWRPITRLMARARYVRQMQQTDFRQGDQNCLLIPAVDVLLHPSAAQEASNPQWPSISSSARTPSTFALRGDPANNLQGAFGMVNLDPFMSLLPADLQADIFGTLAGNDDFSQSTCDDSAVDSWDSW
jgi:Fungal specific transcription factor domain